MQVKKKIIRSRWKIPVKLHYEKFLIKNSSNIFNQFSSLQPLSHVQLFCDPMNQSTPGLPVHHQLPDFTQTHVHRVSDAIQPSHPLSSPSPPALNLSQHQGLFKWVSSSYRVAKVLEFQYFRFKNMSTILTFLPRNAILSIICEAWGTVHFNSKNKSIRQILLSTFFYRWEKKPLTIRKLHKVKR